MPLVIRDVRFCSCTCADCNIRLPILNKQTANVDDLKNWNICLSDAAKYDTVQMTVQYSRVQCTGMYFTIAADSVYGQPSCLYTCTGISGLAVYIAGQCELQNEEAFDNKGQCGSLLSRDNGNGPRIAPVELIKMSRVESAECRVECARQWNVPQQYLTIIN